MMTKKTTIDGVTFTVETAQDCPFFNRSAAHSNDECAYPVNFKGRVLTTGTTCYTPYDKRCKLPNDGV